VAGNTGFNETIFSVFAKARKRRAISRSKKGLINSRLLTGIEKAKDGSANWEKPEMRVGLFSGEEKAAFLYFFHKTVYDFNLNSSSTPSEGN